MYDGINVHMAANFIQEVKFAGYKSCAKYVCAYTYASVFGQA